MEEKVKEAAEISMGTEISQDDIINIQHLCDQVRADNLKNQIKYVHIAEFWSQNVFPFCR